jgi:hypothetical protein
MTYREPFDSDPAARALLDDALLLRENPDGEKFTRYVFALHLRDRPLEQVRVNWTYQRLDDGGYEAVLTAERPIRVATMRVGPFPLQTRAVRVEGIAEPAVLRRGGSRLFADVALNAETDDVKLRVILAPM